MSASHLSPEALYAIQVVSSIGDALALITTAFRIFYRIRINKFWWDDFWALISTPMIVILFVVLWLQPAFAIHPDGRQSTLIVLAWMVPLVFNAVVWTTRLSISFSVTRILPPGKLRKVSIFMAYAFGIMCCGVFAGKIWLCQHDEKYLKASYTCPQLKAVSVAQITTDVLSSVALVVFPLQVLWNVTLPLIERRLILSAFAASFLITIACVVHTAFYSNATMFGLTAHLEAGLSLTICNMLVVSTRLYRLVHREEILSINSGAMDLATAPPMLTEISSRMSGNPTTSTMPLYPLADVTYSSQYSKTSDFILDRSVGLLSSYTTTGSGFSVRSSITTERDARR